MVASTDVGSSRGQVDVLRKSKSKQSSSAIVKDRPAARELAFVKDRPTMRELSPHDSDQLGDLLYDAYHGTVDDEGGTPEDARLEAEQTLSGKYGAVLFRASRIAEIGGIIVSATVVTNFQSMSPLLAFVATAKEHQGKGLARELIDETMRVLKRQGVRRLFLVVTEANDVALKLYTRLGFKPDDQRDR